MSLSKILKPQDMRHLLVTGIRCQSSIATELNEARPFTEIPGPRRLPLIGNAHAFLGKKALEAHKVHQELRKQYGDIYRLNLPGFGDTVFVCDPAQSMELFNKEHKYPYQPVFETTELLRKELDHRYKGVYGLVTQGEDWYNFRRAVQQDMMRVSSAMYYIKDIQEIAEELVVKLKESAPEGEPLDILGLESMFALESIGTIFLGSRLGTLKGQPDGLAMIEAADCFLKNNAYMLYIPWSIFKYTPWFRNIKASVTVVLDICEKHINATINKMETASGDENEAVLFKFVRKCGKDSLIPMVMASDSLAAGIDTTGNTGAFLLYHLATHPEAQEKLYQELVTVLGPSGKLTAENFPKLKYLKACQTESQRMMPIVIGTGRKLQDDLVIGGYKIPKGMNVIRLGQLMSMCPKNFPEPEKFIPERWLRGHELQTKAHPHANMPFGFGARSCIGKRFANLEVQVMAAEVVRSLRMEYEGPKIETETQFINRPNQPIKLKFFQR